MSRAFPAALVLLTAATALAHAGGRNGYAAITIDGRRVRYSLTLWRGQLGHAHAPLVRRRWPRLSPL
jgi:hypothetical protein